VVVGPALGGVAIIALGILAGVVGGYMWKKKYAKNGDTGDTDGSTEKVEKKEEYN